MVFNTDILEKLFNDEQFQCLLIDLSMRWEEEKEYENINNYNVVFEKFINNFYDTTDIKIKTTKRPFGVTIISTFLFKKDGKDINLPAKISVGIKKSGNIYWSATQK